MPEKITARALAGRPDDAITRAAAAFAASLDAGDPFVAGFRDAIVPMAISDPTLPDNPIIYVNEAFERLTGYPPEEVIGRNCRFLQGPLTDLADVARLRAAIARRERITIDLLNHQRDGRPFWNRLLVAPVFAQDGTLRHFVASQEDVTVERERVATLEAEQLLLQAEAEQARAALIDTRRRLLLANSAGAFGTWVFDPVGERLDSSPGCKAIFGRDAGDPFTYDDFRNTVHPDDRARVVAAIAATVERNEPYDLEYRIVTPAGEERWVAVRAELLRRRDGSLLTLSGIAVDISSRKAEEEQRQVVARELTHRVKNTLAIVGAIVGQTLRGARSLEEARPLVAGRIASLAGAHELLMEGEVEGAGLAELAASVLRPFDDGRGTLEVEGPPVRLGPELTLALSMTLHELATNAAKYGALSAEQGRVAIGWSMDAADGRARLHLRWRERGGPPATAPARTGFGTQMMRRVLARHLDGEIASDFAAAGLTVAFTLLL